MLLFLWTVTANAQQVEECGTPDIPLVQLQEFYDDIDSTSEGSVVSGTVAANGLWKISVWFYHLRRSDGTSSQQNTDIEQAIGEVNGYFGGLFEFVVCGTTNIDNDNYYSMDIGNSSTDLSDLWADIAALNEPLSEKCIRVFLVGQGNIHNNGIPFATGYGLDPLNYATPMVLIGSMNGRILAHELGHYFNLPHTFQGGASMQYVHHPTDPENHPVTINGISHTCEQTGDGFCDTPADPRWCNLNNNCQITSCSPGCGSDLM